MKVTVVSRSRREIVEWGLKLSDSATAAELQEAIHKRRKKFYPSGQRLALPFPPGSRHRPCILHYKKNLKEYTDGNSSSLTVVFGDLGPQVLYRTLFLCEYLGPLLLYLVFYFFPVAYCLLGYSIMAETHHKVVTCALYYWSFHYLQANHGELLCSSLQPCSLSPFQRLP